MSGITTIQGNQLFTGSTGRSLNVSTGSAVEAGKQNSAQNVNQNETTSKDGDTVEISAAGTVLSSTMSSQSSSSSDTVSEDEGYTSKMAGAVSSAASAIGITEASAAKSQMSAQAAAVTGSSSDSSSSSTSDLSSYSASQLKQMLENGEITQAEYEAEIQSRSTSTNESSDEA